MTYKHAATLTIRAEGPCANTWAQGNPAGCSASFLVVDRQLLPLSPGEWYELFTYSDFGPNEGCGIIERKDLPHHFEGIIPIMLLRRSQAVPPHWPPTLEEIVLHGTGWLTYNLHRLGVAEEVQFECLAPLKGPSFKLETPIYDGSVLYSAWPWWTQYWAGSTYSFPRCKLMMAAAE
jgi:hypothetical protein